MTIPASHRYNQLPASSSPPSASATRQLDTCLLETLLGHWTPSGVTTDNILTDIALGLTPGTYNTDNNITKTTSGTRQVRSSFHFLLYGCSLKKKAVCQVCFTFHNQNIHTSWQFQCDKGQTPSSGWHTCCLQWVTLFWLWKDRNKT